MCGTTQNFTVVATIIGSSYIAEMHGDEMHHYLPRAEHSNRYSGEGTKPQTSAVFDEVMKSLRSALSLR